MYQSEKPQLVGARNNLLLSPVQLDFTKEVPVEGIPWGPPAAAAAVAFLVLALMQRQKKGAAENELHDMNVQLEIIEYFSRSIFRSNSADDILWDIAAQCISRLDFEDCVIYMLDEDNNQWIQKAAYGLKDIDYREIHKPVVLGISEGIVGDVGLSGQAEIVSDVRKDTRYVVDDAERLSEMAVPIVCDGKVIGVIDSENSKVNFFTRDHLKIIQNVANICGQKIGRSLSEQKTLEFIQVYEQNPDPVLRVNRQGLVLMNNDSAKARFGRLALQGEKVKLPDLMELIEASLSSSESQVASIQIASRIYQVHILPQKNQTFVDIYATDVTDLERARSRAEKAERAKAEFLSIMSHEIRTPLNAIMGLNELLLKDNLKEEHLNQLKYMQYSGKHLLGLVNDILNLESLDRGKVTRKAHNFNLSILLEELAASFSARAKEQGTSLEVKSLTSDAWVRGDRHWVTQMVANLLDNAVKFTKRGSVTVTAKPLPGEDSWRIVVEDTGVGIAEEHLERILDPFEQVLSNPKNTSPDQGTGLGLAIVKRLASLHGGELTVQSTEGVGSKFTLELELHPGSEPNEESDDESVNEGENHSISGAKIMVVDDNPMNLLVAKMQIEKLGHHVVTATNGQEAINTWLSEEPEMILMDIQMPVMDGMEATREIRRRMNNHGAKTLGIVALTADAEPTTKKEALSSGMNDVLVKPTTIDQLDLIIQHWCKVHREPV
jgi:signal transduction histidine kinase/CheY-like chemotaxis protein